MLWLWDDGEQILYINLLMIMMKGTIAVSKEVKDALDKLEAHHRDTKK